LQYSGDVVQWENACLADKRSAVQLRSSPPLNWIIQSFNKKQAVRSNKYMVPNKLIQKWKKDETAIFEGWDFSYIKDRMHSEKESWSYEILARELIRKAGSVLDMGTGGGEIFSFLAPFSGYSVAIEGYGPNFKVARRRLEPLGVKVLEIDGSGQLPFRDRKFDLILNRHSAFSATEVFRILRPGGIFLTQQVGGDDLNDLRRIFGVSLKYESWTLENIKSDIINAGFEIKKAREWKGKVEFTDVGAIVYFLKAIPWIINGFSVESHLKHLEQLQAKLSRGEKLVFTKVRFLLLSKK
jgi:SAM-dependent methyltransferase